MANGPRYTVLMPTHNRADVVGYAIRSVLAQTESDFELLIVGDGCTDTTATVVSGFQDPRIRWFDLPKAPHFGYANRNVALRESRGALVAVAAHDDLLLPDHLERMARPFDDDMIDWAYSRPMWVSDDGLVVPFAIDLRKRAELDHFLRQRNSIPASCVVHRRTCFERFGYWPEDIPMGGDWAYWKSIIGPSAGANLAYVADATCLHFRADWRIGNTWGPPPLDAWLRLAADRSWWPPILRLSVAAGDIPQAIAWRLIDAAPVAWPAALRRGIAEAMDGLAWAAATTVPQIVIELSTLIDQLTHAGSLDSAISVADSAILLMPNDARLQSLHGAALMAARRIKDAEEAFRRAIALDAGIPHYHAQLAEAVYRGGRMEEALTLVDIEIGKHPDNPHLHNLRGFVLAAQARTQEAEAELREALRLEPGLSAAAKKLAELSAAELSDQRG